MSIEDDMAQLTCRIAEESVEDGMERRREPSFLSLLLVVVLALIAAYFLCTWMQGTGIAFGDDRFTPSAKVAEPLTHVGATYYHYNPAPSRSHNTVLKFYKMSGYPHGRAGFVADHVVPLCAGGMDVPSNMQWESREESLKKDAWERKLCNALREGQERYDQP